MPLDTELHKAAHKGDFNTVRELLSSGESTIDEPGAGDRRALHRAAGANHLDILQYLLKHGATLDIKDRVGRTPLHWACISGHVGVTNALIAAGSDVMAVTASGMTPLHAAAATGMAPIVEVLLAYGDSAPVACSTAAMRVAKDSDGKTPYELALERGDKALAKTIKTWGAVGNTSGHSKSAEGKSESPSWCCAGGGACDDGGVDGGGGDSGDRGGPSAIPAVGGATSPERSAAGDAREDGGGGVWGWVVRWWQGLRWNQRQDESLTSFADVTPAGAGEDRKIDAGEDRKVDS